MMPAPYWANFSDIYYSVHILISLFVGIQQVLSFSLSFSMDEIERHRETQRERYRENMYTHRAELRDIKRTRQLVVMSAKG